MVASIHQQSRTARIAIVGKYVELHDAYLSIIESLHHAGFARGADTDILWIDAEEVNGGNVAAKLMGAQGLIVPGGFGGRGIEGKIAACRYARESGLPFLGIRLGMQVAVIEFSRNICGLKEANSTEFADTPYPVIDLMPDQIGVDS